MRRLVALSLGLTVAGGLLGVAPAWATCMDHVNRTGVRVYSCSPPGGPVQTYVCVQETCVPI